ncbi:MAG TPA: bifunctional SulP family inorganic anion transporter/carbonic anhydrase [Pseudonocardiaceae bacterium]|nr:bifunctional SulP family inorganic anion transporter/carbonic anhydrase [Pseudonocardiaceae bacterium]
MHSAAPTPVAPPPSAPGGLHTLLRHDLPASLVVFLVAVPLSLGIAVASGAPVMAGLIAAVVGGIVAGLLGGSPLQVSGPAAGLTVVVADLIGRFGWGVTCAITVAAGLLQVLFGVSRVARAALAISPAVVHAMLAGIGITIVLGQLHVLLGGAPGTDAVTNLVDLPGQLADIHDPAAAVGLAVIAVLLLWSRLPHPLRQVPGPLVAVVAATALATGLALDLERVVIPGSLLDSLHLPEVPGGMWVGVLTGVLTVALIASVESLLCAVATDKMGGTRSNLDRELIGQGAANTVSGLVGGLPVTGVIVRSSTNISAGARTRASTVLHGGWVLLFSVLLVGLIELIPMAALAGLLVVIGLRLVKLADVRSARRQGELAVYLVTAAGVVFLNLLAGVLIGLGLSLLLVLRRVVWSGVHAQQVRPESEGKPASWRVVVEGTLSFLSIPRLSQVLAHVPPGSHVIVEMVVDFLDHAAYEHLASWRRQHEATGGTVVVDEVGPARLDDNGGSGPARRVWAPALPRAFSPWWVWQAQAEHTDHGHGGLRPLIAGVREYHRRLAPELLPHLKRLTDGQRPRALFLTCADSQVVPNVITSSGPGDLFTVRNLGNLVPPPGHESESSVAGALGYAVNHLQVPTILVCGHSGCGAMQTLLEGGNLDGPLDRWLCWGLPSLAALRDGHPVGAAAAAEGRHEVDQLSMVNVVHQIEMLRTYPAVQEAVAAGRIQIAGLFLDIPTARLLLLDPTTGRFLPVPDQPPDDLLLPGVTTHG